MLESGDRVCAMEVSSHALALHRADSIHFEAAIFTNLTQDHLDFHGDMEDYFKSKRLLFEMEAGASIVNIDDPYGRRLAEEFECTTFSVEGAEADYTVRDVRFDSGGAEFTVTLPMGRKPVYISGNRPVGREIAVRTSLPGHFNVANALGAFAVARALGVDPGAAAAGLARAGRVPGRFEPVDEGQSFAVLVDYAHTPDSLENVLRAARRLTEGRVISVFGAGGDRDRDKRPIVPVRMPAELRPGRPTRIGRVDHGEQACRGALLDELVHALEDRVVGPLIRLIAGNEASMAVGGDDRLRRKVPRGKR